MGDHMPDKFDRLLGQLDGLTDTLNTKPATIRVVQPLGIGGSALYIVQTYRQQQRDDGRVTQSADTIFLETVEEAGSLRVVLPGPVADAIARQREALNDRSRKAGARAAVQTKAKKQGAKS